MKQLAWPWPSSYKWKYVVEERDGRAYVCEASVGWNGEHVASSSIALDVGAESLEDLKQALGLMMKCVDKKIKEKANV